jgi:hypothetical protein
LLADWTIMAPICRAGFFSGISIAPWWSDPTSFDAGSTHTPVLAGEKDVFAAFVFRLGLSLAQITLYVVVLRAVSVILLL